MAMPALGGRERELTRIQFEQRQIFDDLRWSSHAVSCVVSSSKWLLSLDQAGSDRPQRNRPLFDRNGRKAGVVLPTSLDGGSSDGYGGLAISPDGRTLAFTLTRNVPIGDVYSVVRRVAERRTAGPG